MSKITKIQWCHSTVNPIMGCGGCELFRSPGEILTALDKAIGWANGTSRREFNALIKRSFKAIQVPENGHTSALTTTNLWHHRELFSDVVLRASGKATAQSASRIISESVACYAARLHCNKARSIVNPSRGINSGYAPAFERVTRFPGRIAAMATAADLLGSDPQGKPWLNGLCRLIFVSDMGDAFSRSVDFDFLETDVISAIRSEAGKRHFWLWLTKRPKRMAQFAKRLGNFPRNICAMTTITGPDSLSRVDELREVNASVRGLSIEPLRQRLPPERLDLSGISWVILGGESGRKDHVHQFDLEWVVEIRDVCRAHGTAFFLKQLGRRPVDNGRELILKDTHGGDWSEWPNDLRVREIPHEIRSYRQKSVSNAAAA